MKITDFYIWDVVGLDIEDSEREELEEGLSESAWYRFLSEDLEKLLKPDEYKGLIEKFNANSSTKEQFVLAIKQKLESKSVDFDQKMAESLEQVLKTFVSDQIEFEEKSVNDLQDPTEKTLKQAFVKNLKDLFSQEQWDQMGEIFRKISNYNISSQGLVTN